MQEFKGNSFASKEQSEPMKMDETIVEPVVKTPVKIKKESEIGKFARKLISEDAGNVGSHLVEEIIIPGIQKLLVDGGKAVLDWIFYGFRGGSRGSSTVGGVSYSKYYDKSRPPVLPQTMYSRPNPIFVNEIIFEDGRDEEGRLISGRGAAEAVLAEMQDYLITYGDVSVAYFYQKAGQKYNYTDNDWGWKDLTGVCVTPVRGGYMIKLPKVISLK